MNFTVLDQYKSFVENNFIKKDPFQIDVLERIYDLWKMKDEKNFFFKNKFKTGVYLFGHVGSGKTFLLNIFCQHTKVGKKIHFNHLMNEIHNKINLNNNKNDNLEKYVKNLSKNKKVIFIDELHIFNIVDALIVKKLFTFFNKYKIFVLASSNFHPKDLYKDGLQRADFVPFIDFLIKNFGMDGAAWATLLSFSFQFILYSLISNKYILVKYQKSKLFIIVTSIFSMYIINKVMPDIGFVGNTIIKFIMIGIVMYFFYRPSQAIILWVV